MQTNTLTPEQALSLLRSQIQDHLESVQEDSKQVIDKGQFEQAQTLLQQAQSLKDLLKDLDAWAKRFATLVGPIVEGGDEETPRLRKGLKTPQSAYQIPILRVLVTLGGEATMDAVLAQVETLMADQLNDYDRSTLSDGKTIRWVNTAQWARNALREEGLIRDDTPRGVWGISSKGEAWLKEET